MFSKPGKLVSGSAEFERIKNLPKREPEKNDFLTYILRTPDGIQTLRSIQVQALHDLKSILGLFAPIRVGGGKTLISLLCPQVVKARRPLLILPASLIEKTTKERMALSRHWQIAKHLRLFSYEALGRVNASKELEIYKPDLIIADECHRLKNKRAACTRRVARYMKENPNTMFVAMSGTVMKNSLHDFAHILAWTHKDKAPIPIQEEVINEWANALDEKVNPLSRQEPGVLIRLTDIGNVEGNDLFKARRAFNKRLAETPGVIISDSPSGYQGSLYLNSIKYSVNSTTHRNFETLREKAETPDGWALTEAVDIWRHAREMSLGLHYIWSPRPPLEWLDARRVWAKFVRDYLSRSRTLDTELQVSRAVIAGDIKDGGLLKFWQDLKPSFEINQKPIWHDDSALELCEEWLHEKEGICWVEHRFFGRELAKRTGYPYFGSAGMDDGGESIESSKGPIIASIAANSTGRNLQRWSRNLITAPMAGADAWEQLIGRTHREGQVADEVHVDVLMGCFEHFSALQKAMGLANAQKELLGYDQKLLLADANLHDLEYLKIIDKNENRDYNFRWR